MPIKKSAEHEWLLVFIVLTHLRNPASIDNHISSNRALNKELAKLDPSFEMEEIPKLSHEEVVNFSLKLLLKFVDGIADLNYKLFINKTSTPFITSDHPVIKYNSFLENKKHTRPITGYATSGLQIFIPINSEIMIVLYDSEVYKIGEKKLQHCEILKEEEITQFNILQFLNCLEMVYFDEKVSKNYLEAICAKSSRFLKPYVALAKSGYWIKNKGEKIRDEEQQNLVMIEASECKINLKIDSIKVHRNLKKWKLDLNTVITRAKGAY